MYSLWGSDLPSYCTCAVKFNVCQQWVCVLIRHLALFPTSVPGLSAPVPRGRKGKKLKNQLNIPDVKNADWLVHCNPEVVLQDESYKKHLKQHCNKLVLTPLSLLHLTGLNSCCCVADIFWVKYLKQSVFFSLQAEPELEH